MANYTPDMIEKAKTARSAEELVTLAKENGLEMSAGEAEVCFARLHPVMGELDDDDLDNVAGGGCGSGGASYDRTWYGFMNGERVHAGAHRCPLDQCQLGIMECGSCEQPDGSVTRNRGFRVLCLVCKSEIMRGTNDPAYYGITHVQD